MNVLTFKPNGTGHGLYTEVVDLSALGPLTIERASTVEFNPDTQQWEVYTTTGDLLYSNASRASCLAWEHQHFNQ